jgi:hypothetical protein
MHLDFRTAPFWVITQWVIVITQKNAVLVYFVAEARNHAFRFDIVLMDCDGGNW